MFKKYIIYLFIKEKYAIFPTLRLILSVFKRISILIYKLNLNNNLLFKVKPLKLLKFILLKEVGKYRNILNFKHYKTCIVLYKIKMIIKLIYKKKKQYFILIFIKKFYIFKLLIGSILIILNIPLLIFLLQI